MNTLELTKKLISLPSFVDDRQNEQLVADYLCNYVSKNIPWLTVTKQYIGKNRYNIIAKNCDDPSVVFISHMDTVLPQRKECLTAQIKENKLYGLGACDMKSGMAASIMALQNAGPTSKAALIFDCDEEYYFKGALAIVNKYALSPRLVVFPEPTDMQITSKCRGVVEIEFTVKGKTAHASNPNNGKNAIALSVQLVALLEKAITGKGSAKTTVNLGGLQGGILKNGKICTQPNAVPDTARLILDIRTAKKDINAKKIVMRIKQIADKLKIEIEDEKINLDYPPFQSDKKYLKQFEKAVLKTNVPIKYTRLNDTGFFEASFFANKWNCEAVAFGPGNKNTAHAKNEYVNIPDLITVEKIFTKLIS